MTVSVVAVVAAAVRDAVKFKSVVERQCVGDNAERIAEAVVVAQREAVTITTVEQLDALPVGSSVVTQGVPEEFGEVYGAGTWTKGQDTRGDWYWWAMDYGEPASEIALPALLIWSPEWSTR